MITSFQELERHVLSHGLRGRIALANAQDEPALAALVRAQRAGAAEGTLIGPADEIARLLRRMGEQVSDYEIVPFTGTELDAAKLAVRTVREGRADMLMKGLLHTADFARAILNRETGLMPQTGRRLLSQCGFFQYDGRIVLITDAAININPDVETQIGIVENTLPVAHALGIETPKVAVLSAVETVSEKMPSTVTAREVARRGIPGCVVSGPLAIDSAATRRSATPWPGRRICCSCRMSRWGTSCIRPAAASRGIRWPARSAARPARSSSTAAATRTIRSTIRFSSPP